jgi:solute carrier family 35, member F5
MLLTSPLVVTVGISLTIPLSLIGQMILNRQFSGGAYWVGAGIVFLSFIFINHESKDDNTTTRKCDIDPSEVADGVAE